MASLKRTLMFTKFRIEVFPIDPTGTIVFLNCVNTMQMRRVLLKLWQEDQLQSTSLLLVGKAQFSELFWVKRESITA